jgi:hypothetical protein
MDRDSAVLAIVLSFLKIFVLNATIHQHWPPLRDEQSRCFIPAHSDLTYFGKETRSVSA